MANNTQTTQSEVAEIYISTFGRAPDKAGLDYWVGQVEAGALSVAQVAESFFDQPETKATYGESTNTEFLIAVYKNTLDKTVDANDAGLKYWLSELDAGQYTRDGFIKTLINGAKADTGDADDAKLLQNKVDVGLLYSQEIGVADSPLAKQIMSDVDADTASVQNAMGTVDYYAAWVDEYATALGYDKAISEEDIWKNIDDSEFLGGLNTEYNLGLKNANFWEQTDSIWDNTATSNVKFDFLSDSTVWSDPSIEQKFHARDYSDIAINDILTSVQEHKILPPIPQIPSQAPAANIELAGVIELSTELF